MLILNSKCLLKLLAAPVLVLPILLSTANVNAAQLKLEATNGSSLVLAGKKQTVPLRLSLTGFEIASSKQRAPVNVSIVLDRSSSMSGDKIVRAKEAAILAVNSLSPDDIFSLVTYDNIVEVVIPATKASDKERIIQEINAIYVRGSTALYAGVSKGAQELEKFMEKERVNRVILLSDGQANQGPSSPYELGNLGQSLAKQGISVSTIGLGLGYNEDLMTQLAGKSDGNHEFVENSNDLARVFQKEFGDIVSVVAKNIEIKITCPEGIRPIRSIGREAEITGQTVRLNLNQIYAKQEKYLVLELEVPPGKSGQSTETALVEVSYANMDTKANEKLTSTVSLGYSESQGDVDRSVNKATLEAYYSQLAIEASNKAIVLRDAGKINEARDLMVRNGSMLNQNAIQYNIPGLNARALANADQTSAITSGDWQRNRKDMSAENYQLQNQQMRMGK